MPDTVAASDELTVSTPRVTVHKYYTESEYPLPAIVLSILYWIDDPGTVTVVEELPRDIGSEDIGINPNTREYWTVTDEELTVEYEFGGASEFKTAYSAKDELADTVEKWLTEPEITVSTAAEN